MHAKVGGGSRRSSMGIGPQKSNPLLLLSVLGRVQCPLKTQTIFIPKSPGSSPACSRPWEPYYNGEDSRKVLEWRMWWDLDKDPVHHPHHVDREIQAKINHPQLKGKVCTREDYSPRPRQALCPRTWCSLNPESRMDYMLLPTWQCSLCIWEFDPGFILKACPVRAQNTSNTVTQSSKTIPQGVPLRLRTSSTPILLGCGGGGGGGSLEQCLTV